jgi:4'-phosphopantetheinyl transferase
MNNWPELTMPIALSPGVVHVVRVDLDRASPDWMPYMDNLTDGEKDRAWRFRFDEPRRQFVMVRAILRRILASCCEMTSAQIPLTFGNHGKPSLQFDSLPVTTPRIEFNVSHSGDVGLIAISAGAAVGIDVETSDRTTSILELAQRYFSSKESAALRNLPTDLQTAGFFRGWTSKEAYIKAKGAGLALSLASFHVEIDPTRPAALLAVDNDPAEPANWTTQSLEIEPPYSATVMVARPNCLFRMWNWTHSFG